jgi:long-chain fatty acid transport protein
MEGAMNRFTLTHAAALAGLLAAGTDARAAGFAIYEHDAESMARAGAVAAYPNVAGSLYNVGVLGALKGLKLRLGDTLIFPSTTYIPRDGGARTDATTPVQPPPNLYASYTLSDLAGVGDLAFGLGLFPLYGLVLEWPEDWAGRFENKSADLKTFTVNPGVAFRLAKRVSLGIGFQLVIGSVHLKSDADLGGGHEAALELVGKAIGYSFNVGLYANPIDELHVGVQWRHSTKMPFKGDADVTHSEGTPGGTRALLYDQGVGAGVTLPGMLSAGIGYDLTKDINLEFDVNLVTWSELDGFTIDFEEAGTPDARRVLDWRDSITFRVGGTWRTPVEGLQARLGYVYDLNPVPDHTLSPLLPDSNRHLFAIGAGYAIAGFSVDVGYNYVLFLNRAVWDSTEHIQGAYETDAHLLGLSLGYSLE